MEPDPPPSSTDVLILGAGLAGLRAALSCLLAAPSLRVSVVSLTGGPSGSSFANQNDALGMHACLTDQEREDYVREVLALNQGASRHAAPRHGDSRGQAPERAAPGLGAWLSEGLLAVQAEEGAERLHDLVELGLRFTRDQSGALLPHSSCFSPHSRRAYVFTGLTHAYSCLRSRLEALGCEFLSGWMPARIVGESGCNLVSGPVSGPLSGVVFAPAGGGNAAFVAAKAVVAALGGPARLYAHSMAGPGVPGYGQGLLARAGAAMANQGYLQFMWASVPGKRFWQPAEIGQGGWKLLLPGNGERSTVPLEDLVPDLADLAKRRAGHCPIGYGLEDSRLDLALGRGLGPDGVARLARPDGSRMAVAPMAHASNGGAVIDANGETTVEGLLACGECATGMHGANRLGGGMVLATQVFGHRAGARAAWIARNRGFAKPGLSDDTLVLPCDAALRRDGLDSLGQELSRFAVPGSGQGRHDFAARLEIFSGTGRDWLLPLCLETALAILAGLPDTL